MLFIVRFLFGIGEAGAYPNATIVIQRWFPKQEAGRAQSVIWIASRLGAALAPFISIYIMTIWGWRYVFYIFGGLGILWAIFWGLWFQNEPKNMPGIDEKELDNSDDDFDQLGDLQQPSTVLHKPRASEETDDSVHWAISESCTNDGDSKAMKTAGAGCRKGAPGEILSTIIKILKSFF